MLDHTLKLFMQSLSACICSHSSENIRTVSKSFVIADSGVAVNGNFKTLEFRFQMVVVI